MLDKAKLTCVWGPTGIKDIIGVTMVIIIYIPLHAGIYMCIEINTNSNLADLTSRDENIRSGASTRDGKTMTWYSQLLWFLSDNFKSWRVTDNMAREQNLWSVGKLKYTVSVSVCRDPVTLRCNITALYIYDPVHRHIAVHHGCSRRSGNPDILTITFTQYANCYQMLSSSMKL